MKTLGNGSTRRMSYHLLTLKKLTIELKVVETEIDRVLNIDRALISSELIKKQYLGSNMALNKTYKDAIGDI